MSEPEKKSYIKINIVPIPWLVLIPLSTMFKENIFNEIYRIIIKMPASRKEKIQIIKDQI